MYVREEGCSLRECTKRCLRCAFATCVSALLTVHVSTLLQLHICAHLSVGVIQVRSWLWCSRCGPASTSQSAEAMLLGPLHAQHQEQPMEFVVENSQNNMSLLKDAKRLIIANSKLLIALLIIAKLVST